MTIVKHAKILPPSTKGTIYEITVDAPGGGEDKLSYQFDGAEMDVLNCLFVHGPTWDGNIPSKSARDELCRFGLVFHAHGFATLTGAGMIVCIKAELIVKEFKDRRWSTKLHGDRLRITVEGAQPERFEPSVEVRVSMTPPEERIANLVNRFLMWPLPDGVASDICATTPNYPHRHGTNLLTADEARKMIEYLFEEPAYADPPETVMPREDERPRPIGSIRVVWNPEGYIPRFQHYSTDAARAEARRLAIEVPGARFLVLESIGEFSVEKPVPKWTPHDQTVDPLDAELPF